MKLSYEAQELLATTLAKRGARYDTEEIATVMVKADCLAAQREESAVAKSTLADAMGTANWLDSAILGARDGRNWATEAHTTNPSAFTAESFTQIAAGLDATDLKGLYLRGWREGIWSMVRDFRNGTVK